MDGAQHNGGCMFNATEDQLDQAYNNQIHGHITLGEIGDVWTSQNFLIGVASSLAAGLILLYAFGKEA